MKPLVVIRYDDGEGAFQVMQEDIPDRIRLSRRSKRRFADNLRLYEELHIAGAWSEADLARHVEPLVAFTRHADAAAWRATASCVKRL